MWYRIGADLVLVIHLLFISFVVGGGFPTWRGIWISWAHIPAASYDTLVEFAGFTCPRCYSSARGQDRKYSQINGGMGEARTGRRLPRDH
jgi:hypothetical protein